MHMPTQIPHTYTHAHAQMFKVLSITFALNPLSFLKYGEDHCPTSPHYEVCGQALAKR